MKRIFLLLTLIAAIALPMAAQQQGERRQPITQEQIEQMNARRSQMVKEQLNLTAEQEPLFDKEYANYNNIVLATRTQQFKNRIEKGSTVEQAVATINDAIDSQLAELVAKKQMINRLKDVLSAEQLARLHMLTSGMPMGGMRSRQGDGANQSRRDGSQRRARQGGDWGSGFGGIDPDDNQ